MVYNETDLTIYLIRHAEATNNIHPEFISGRTYTAELTKRGIEQSIFLGERLLKDNIFFNTVYSSPIKRALDTANIVSTILSIKTNAIIKVDSLEELDFGDWEGRPASTIYTKEILKSIKDHGDFFTPPNGESKAMVERRVSEWFDTTILKNKKYLNSKTKIAIFTHSFVINVLLHHILKFDDRAISRIETSPSSVSILHYKDDSFSVVSVNDICHLA